MKQDSSSSFAKDIKIVLIILVTVIFLSGFICARIIK
jgi:hypothetical protein